MPRPDSPHPGGAPPAPRRVAAFFRPILPGATWRDRWLASLGALLALGLTGLVSRLILGPMAEVPLLVAPMGAAAVLLFVVPSSPMAQPWPIVGGNALSCLIGIAVAKLLPDPLLAAPLALTLAILAMSLTRSMHPPGGAAALTGVLGGAPVEAAGFGFALAPMALDSALLVLFGCLFHRAMRHNYPHRPPPAPVNRHGTADQPPALRVGFSSEDVDAALAAAGEAFDIGRGDLDRLLRSIEQQALERRRGELSVADIMSRDVVKVGRLTDLATARRLLLEHNIRLLPVVDEAERLIGTVGLRELETPGSEVAAVMVPAQTVPPDQPAVALVPRLSDGRAHAVVVVDEGGRILGLVTQTDLLAALARSALHAARG